MSQFECEETEYPPEHNPKFRKPVERIRICVYVFLIEGGGVKFTGYGATSNFHNRSYVHIGNILKAGKRITRQKMIEFESFDDVLRVELKIKQTFEKFANDVRGFITESTSADNFDAVVSFAESEAEKLRLTR